MPIDEPSDSLPLADALRAANGLVAEGLIEDWALGGALAAIYYVEPFTTYDADIFFIPKDKGLASGIPAIYEHLQSQGWKVEREHLLVRGFPVQFLAASDLTEEAVREAERIDYEGVPAKVFRAEHIVAITRFALSNYSSRPTWTRAAWKTSWNGIDSSCRSYESRDATKTGPRTVSGKDPKSRATRPFGQDVSAPPPVSAQRGFSLRVLLR